MARIGRRVLHPGLLEAGLLVIRARESNDVAHVIRTLAGATPPSLALVEQRVRSARYDPEPGPPP